MTAHSDLPHQHADELRRLIEAGAVPKIIAFIEGISSPLERRQLFGVAQQALAKRKDADRDLDALIAVVHAAIVDGTRQAAAAGDPAEAQKRKDYINVLSYNLAADLAECWPDDLARRTHLHFETGLAAAKEAVRLREELGKPAGPRSMAWWACGAHELSLGRAKDAAASFERSLDFARKAAKGAPAACVEGGDFHVVLASGCLGLATRTRCYDDACAAFDATAAKGEGEAAEDAKFGAAQLRWFAKRLADPSRPADLRF